MTEQSPLHLLEDNEKVEDKKYRLKSSDLDPGEFEEKSFEKNAALLAVSKNMLIMEDNIE